MPLLNPPTVAQLDAREAYLHAELAASEYADDFASQRAEQRRIREELASIATWREILAGQAA